MVKQLMIQKLKLTLKILLTLIILYSLHIMDSLALEYFLKTMHGKFYPFYENIRLIVHIALWVIVLVFGILIFIDFVREKKLIKNWKSQFFAWFLLILVCTELPIYSCYDGAFEPFWKPFHFH